MAISALHFGEIVNILDYKIGMKLPDKITVLYSRLSRDDKDKDKESNSIINQKKMLAQLAFELNLPNPIFFTDDGVSGTTFERPHVQAALSLMEEGRVKCFVTKDLSRFGRDNALVNYYIDYVFPKKDIRFIAKDDNVDITTGLKSMETQFKIMFNEHYPRETSEKVRAVFRAKGMAGEPLTFNPPYGYAKSLDNPKQWIIDESSAQIVRQIFQWCMEGLGVTHIANRLRAEQVETPIVYANNAGIRKSEKFIDPYDWNDTTVGRILERRQYLGHTVNFQTYRKSYKDKRQFQNAPENQYVFENTHPAIIETEVFERVQQIRQGGKRRRNHSGRVALFSGLVFCADCKNKLYMSSGACLKPENDNFSCSAFRTKKNPCHSSHYIRRVVLEQAVLQFVRQVSYYAQNHEKAFLQKLQTRNTDRFRKEFAIDKKSLQQAERRIQELDGIIQKLFEGNVTGKISDERFAKLSQTYEQEQKDLTSQIEFLQERVASRRVASENLNNYSIDSIDVEMFLSRIRKYTRPTELTTVMLNELIERVEVHAPDKSSGKRVQQIDVYFNY
ncbi:MAG: DUF4368 domain-containing protein [Oscillospiraceae bacterium]|nr:DUF4368 domain-containing protein [Oscillospiraceae bacterium]